jgi:hypothetical protein
MILIFYFNIIALILHLIVSRFVSFRTIRERDNKGGDIRYRTDFLDFCKEDVHWFTIWMCQIFLCYYSLKVRSHRAKISITVSLTLVIIKLLIFGALMILVFFTKVKLSIKKIAPGIALIFGINMALSFSTYRLYEEYSLFWFPFVLEETVIGFVCIG